MGRMPVVSTPQGVTPDSKSPFRREWRMDAVIPLCVTVALAIICIVVAALTSAQRANDLAVEHERDMLRNAIVYRGEWSLRKLKAAALPAINEETSGKAADQLINRIRAGQRALIDHDF